MEYQDSDLLGDPVRPNLGGRGRPQHVPNDETWRKVNLLWAEGCSNAECASALGISEPTFNRHYFKKSAHRRAREQAALKVKAETLAALMAEVRAGNIAAIDKMLRRIDAREMREAQHGKPRKETPLGKKAALIEAAKAPDASSGWGDLLN